MSEQEPNIPDFEKSLSELEALVERMERGELTLEQSLEHFERGMKLSRSCQLALEQARLKVDQLLSDATTEPFDAGD